jgi:hypothetical protein
MDGRSTPVCNKVRRVPRTTLVEVGVLSRIPSLRDSKVANYSYLQVVVHGLTV